MHVALLETASARYTPGDDTTKVEDDAQYKEDSDNNKQPGQDEACPERCPQTYLQGSSIGPGENDQELPPEPCGKGTRIEVTPKTGAL